MARTAPIGAWGLLTSLNEDGSAQRRRCSPRAGFLEDTGEYLGRTVDVAQLPDGPLLVSDDLAAAL